jgi:hypothetical protein
LVTYQLTVPTDPELATLWGTLTVRMFLFANPLVWRCHKFLSIRNTEHRAQHAGAHVDISNYFPASVSRAGLSHFRRQKNAATVAAAPSQGGAMKRRKTCSNFQIQLP